MQLKPTPHLNQPILNAEKKQISYRLIKEYKREPLNEKNTQNMIVWWIVAWGQGPEVLEKRRIYVSSKTGILKTYKQMPWHIQDMKWLSENFADIVDTLQS